MIKKLLIANRGEIACRIIRTAQEMEIETIALYSDADGEHGVPLWCEMADERVPIGGRDEELGVEPYLLADRIIGAAVSMEADAIHPGYGFLSENPEFVEAVEAAGLVFVGPSADAIRAMGLKDAAKKLMEKAKVPVVPGYHGSKQGAKFLAEQAEKIGYPVLIKARAGGGGKGMRKVDDPKDFASALEGAVREGKASFGDGRVLIEKFISNPRHIEIQVFGDNHGNVVHLFERDCSLQRRHQKVIEEAPAPGMTDVMRAAMGEAAVKAAQAINYSGAGTVEFIVDGSKGLKPDGFWFMEMNTRLQVEHPVTEEITGLDLVEWQLRVASDEYLPKFQDELAIDGHAFEARLYAEDVSKGFLPAVGTLDYLEFPDDARIESGVEEGGTITPFYDPMIAKIITHGETREEALAALEEALGETRIAGTVTNAQFLRSLCNHTGFAKGKVDTGLIERDLETLTDPASLPDHVVALAAKHALGLEGSPNSKGWADASGSGDPFYDFLGFAIWGAPVWRQNLELGGTQYSVQIRRHGSIWQCKVSNDGENFSSWFTDSECLDPDDAPEVFMRGCEITVFAQEAHFNFTIPDPLAGSGAGEEAGDAIIAPMPGLVNQVNIKTGSKVSEGDALILMEAMKMEHVLTAPRDGVISELSVTNGDQVSDGAILVSLVPEDAK